MIQGTGAIGLAVTGLGPTCTAKRCHDRKVPR